MPHNLRQSMEWDGLCHPIAETVTQIMRTDIRERGLARIFFDDVAQGTFRESMFRLARWEKEDCIRKETWKILLQHFASRPIQRHLTVFIAFANDFEEAAPLAQ